MKSNFANMKLALIFLLSTFTVALPDNNVKPHKDKYKLNKNCEAGIHSQIDEEMRASLTYAAMAAYFDNNGVARKGFATFFEENSKEEREHAHKFIDYLNRRGGKFSGFDIKMPSTNSWDDGLAALQSALDLEKHVNNKLYHLHSMAQDTCEDQHLMDFIETDFLDEQVESIDRLQRYVTMLGRMNDGMGEYLFDRQLLDKKSDL